jgi:hypothetical protein
MTSEAPEIIENELPQEEMTPTPVSGVVVAHGVDITDRSADEVAQFYEEAGPAVEALREERLAAMRERNRKILEEETRLQELLESIG